MTCVDRGPPCQAALVDDRTPAEDADAGRDSPDPLIHELRREQRHRLVLVVAAVVGIVSGVATGMAFVLGALGDAARAPIGVRNPGLLVFFVGPPIVCMAIGHAIFAVLRRRR
jgi:hypothetical protein